MNTNTRRALLLDAYYQVVDNWIYRLMLLFVLTLVLASFLVGMRENEISVFFGAWTLAYDDVLPFIGVSPDMELDAQQIVIQAVQNQLTDNLIGQFGMVMCLAATSFFVPRLLEKGAADIVFAKPVSRFSLLLSRYVAGLLFVGSLSIILVIGIWIGLLVSSGYDDTGFLWGALTLLYLFAILHAVSICIGVFTRSSVAAMLLAVLFFALVGGIQWTWETKEFIKESDTVSRLRRDIERSGVEVAPSAPHGREEIPAPLIVLGTLLNTAHVLLPKFSDADVITRQLRRALAPAEDVLADPVGHVTLRSGTSGFQRIRPDPRVEAYDLAAEPARWVLRDETGREVASIEALRRSRIAQDPRTPKDPPKAKPVRLNSAQLGAEVLQRVKSEETGASEPVSAKAYLDGSFAQSVRWSTAERELTIYVAPVDDWALEVREEAERTWLTTEQREEHFAKFRAGIQLARQAAIANPGKWYEQKFHWRAPLPFNSLFSVASSMLFTVLMLFLAWWKLRRIDF